jgi:hypothetical protein
MLTQTDIPPNVGSNLVGMLLDTAYASMAHLRSRISNVRYASSDIAVEKNCECINFEFDGATWLGELRGRNRDLMLSLANAEVDKALALRVMLDACAQKV